MEALITLTARTETAGMRSRLTPVMAIPTVMRLIPEVLDMRGSVGVIMAVVTSDVIMSSRIGKKATEVSGVIYSCVSRR